MFDEGKPDKVIKCRCGRTLKIYLDLHQPFVPLHCPQCGREGKNLKEVPADSDGACLYFVCLGCRTEFFNFDLPKICDAPIYKYATIEQRRREDKIQDKISIALLNLGLDPNEALQAIQELRDSKKNQQGE
jgi:hypothetical protein